MSSNQSDVLDYYKQSGTILKKAMKLALNITKPGEKLYDIAESVEKLIIKEEGWPAFPVNISINEQAAHYSPVICDDKIIPTNSVVKIDLGVSYKGFLTDCARTCVFDDTYFEMYEIAKGALDKGLNLISNAVSVYDIGKKVENYVKKSGFKTISNLSGHSLDRYNLHSGVSIPSTDVPFMYRHSDQVFTLGKAYAVEPFVTDGKGKVENGKDMTIFRQYNTIKTKNLPTIIREIYLTIKNDFFGLPFSPRWLYNKDYSVDLIDKAINVLMNKRVLYGYAILVEMKGGQVTQAEDSIFLTEEGIINLTRECSNFK